LKIYHRASSAPASGAGRAAGRDEADTSGKTSKPEAKTSGAGQKPRQSLAVVKSQQNSAEASPNKRRKNSDQSK
jgi:hypothetical protein